MADLMQQHFSSQHTVIQRDFLFLLVINQLFGSLKPVNVNTVIRLNGKNRSILFFSIQSLLQENTKNMIILLQAYSETPCAIRTEIMVTNLVNLKRG